MNPSKITLKKLIYKKSTKLKIAILIQFFKKLS